MTSRDEPCETCGIVRNQVATKSSIKQPLISVKSAEWLPYHRRSKFIRHMREKGPIWAVNFTRKPVLRVESSYLLVNQGVEPIGVDDRDLGLAPEKKSFSGLLPN